MSIEKVKEYFKQWGKEKDVLEFDTSSATVELAAKAVGVIPARIAKTLSFQDGDGCILIVTAGDRRIDNGKFKKFFQMKARMLSPDDVLRFTGYEIGGVCPFVIEDSKVAIYCDISMKRFETVFPACGSSNSAIELTCDELFNFSKAKEWIDVCKE
jgi:prolyl-tRNA editing enzyme YbaK/EbsC (Cys-tRNA(Pro) deacylase)